MPESGRLWRALLLAALVTLGAPAAAREPIQRPPDTARNRFLLADTLGAMHYLTIACSGKLAQQWRSRMGEMLNLEGLAEGERNDLIEAFNHGYRRQKAYFPACTPQTVSRIGAQKRFFAEQGKILAAALADPYLH